MALDAITNFGKAPLAAGYAAGVTAISVAAGTGGRLPVAPFNAVWWNATDYPDPADDPNVEIVRCTVIAGDNLTVTRGQEGTADSAHNTVGKTYILINTMTAFIYNQIAAAFADAPAGTFWGNNTGGSAAPSFQIPAGGASNPFPPPVASDWTLTGSVSGCSIVDVGDGTLRFAGNNPTGICGVMLPVPGSAPYSFRVMMNGNAYISQLGIFAYNSVNGRLTLFHISNGGNGFDVTVSNWHVGGGGAWAFDSTVLGSTFPVIAGNVVLSLINDGTNFGYCGGSDLDVDGVVFAVASLASWVGTPTDIGVHSGGSSTGFSVGILQQRFA